MVWAGTVAAADQREWAGLADASSSCPSVRAGVWLCRFPSPTGMIMVAVRWYLRYALSYRDVEELLAERGITVAIYRRVQRFTPWFIDAAGPCRHAPEDRWFAAGSSLPWVAVPESTWRTARTATAGAGRISVTASHARCRCTRPPWGCCAATPPAVTGSARHQQLVASSSPPPARGCSSAAWTRCSPNSCRWPASTHRRATTAPNP
jgi:hypothetical protein